MSFHGTAGGACHQAYSHPPGRSSPAPRHEGFARRALAEPLDAGLLTDEGASS
jgi:hypothetical protein